MSPQTEKFLEYRKLEQKSKTYRQLAFAGAKYGGILGDVVCEWASRKSSVCDHLAQLVKLSVWY